MPQLLQTNRSAYTGVNSGWTRTASLATNLGDACYIDEATNKVSPAGSFPDQGDEASTQRAFAGLFMGLAGNAQLVTSSTSVTAKQYYDLEIEVTCTSTTFELGDYVAPKYTTGALDPQTYVKVTDPSRATGKVMQRYGSATTTVWVRMSSRNLMGLVADVQQGETFSAQPGDASGDAGAALLYEGGEGADHTSGTAGAGGSATWRGGAGGTATSGTGGAGGAVVIGGVAGGTATTGTAGAGGANTLTAGAGGAASGAAGVGGAGGAWAGRAGAGGAAAGATGTGGVGGAWSAGGGNGGAATDTGATAAGVGGATSLVSGTGGASSTTAVAGGAAGAFSITGGAGGAGAATGTGGAGATIAIAAGAGGATSGAGTGGAGGNVTIAGGAGGTTSGGTAGAMGIVTVTGLRTVAGTTAVAITGATTLKLSDSGGVFTVAQSSAYAVTLPSPTSGPGLRFLFQLVSPGANNVTLTVAGGAATFEGTIQNDVTSTLPATGGTFTFASGTAALGDWIEVVSTSTSKYFARTSSSAAGGITIA